MKRYLLAVAVTLPLFACSSTDPELAAEVEEQSERIAQVEQQLASISTSLEEMEGEHEESEAEHESVEASTFELAVAMYVMDSAGFHAIDDALSETGEIDPAYASTVTRVARVVGSTQWPHGLSEAAAHLLEVLTDFQNALSDDDVGAASPLAALAHEHQHDLSAAISDWLSGEISEHEHEGEG